MENVNKQLLDLVSSVLACEIEAVVFERHVVPALNVARKVAAEQAQQADPVELRNVFDEMFDYSVDQADDVSREWLWRFSKGLVDRLSSKSPAVAMPDERAAFEAWLQENIDDTDTVRPSKEKVDAYFAVWLARSMLAAAQKGG